MDNCYFLFQTLEENKTIQAWRQMCAGQNEVLGEKHCFGGRMTSPLFSLILGPLLGSLHLFTYLLIIEIKLISNVVPISAVQQSASAAHIQTFFSIFFSIMVYHDTEYSSLCYTLGPCCLPNPKCNRSHLPTPNSQSIPLPPHPLGNHKSVLYVCESVSGTA